MTAMNALGVNVEQILALTLPQLLDEAKEMLSRLRYEDLAADEAVALTVLLRPIHDRVQTERQHRTGKPNIRLIPAEPAGKSRAE